ncbi:hypothetical protein ALC57_14786 [Trachymyrmex cornetzi]|uniref:Transposable element Tc3 transposase n=1 Tax=Trachymyrmex cornetzi TaxID=471704 RepID=A0A151IXV3_9HYME|nr:hypothetical protein ALC57_14786 [Trachymyrmex cornetzi]
MAIHILVNSGFIFTYLINTQDQSKSTSVENFKQKFFTVLFIPSVSEKIKNFINNIPGVSMAYTEVINKSSLKNDALLNIPSVRSIINLGEQDLSYCTFPNFEVSIFFTDEADFSEYAITNYHNNHLWSYENPHDIIESQHQHKFSCNVWAGVIGNFLLGQIFFSSTLNGNNYRQFLETQPSLILEDVPLQIRNQMWFMHDGAPAHFSRTA